MIINDHLMNVNLIWEKVFAHVNAAKDLKMWALNPMVSSS